MPAARFRPTGQGQREASHQDLGAVSHLAQAPGFLPLPSGVHTGARNEDAVLIPAGLEAWGTAQAQRLWACLSESTLN